MRKLFLFSFFLLTLPFNVAAQTCNWSDLIGKKLVLYRYGRMLDGYFADYVFTNPVGEKPMEQLVLTDSTHFEWKYALTGDFSHECSLNDSVMEINPPFFHNRRLCVVQRKDNVVVTEGQDGITRAFFIEEPQVSTEALPASCNSKNGFCDGKLDDLLPSFSDFTYHTATPMGRHFLFSLNVGNEEKKWLASTDDPYTGSVGVIKSFDINLYPNGKPVVADVNQKTLTSFKAISAMAEMAFLYPEFIKSIIHQESAESFLVDMFDPQGNPIEVRVSNRFLVMNDGTPIFSVGKDNRHNWMSILEKAMLKWIQAYQHVNRMAYCNAEWMIPMFTGDGRSFCIQPGRLSHEELARVLNTCLEYGLMVNGCVMKDKIVLDGHETAIEHGYTLLPPQKAGALYSLRDPAGGGDDDLILNIMNDEKNASSLLGIRIISPGAAAKYFGK